jgi:hypothetical protein
MEHNETDTAGSEDAPNVEKMRRFVLGIGIVSLLVLTFVFHIAPVQGDEALEGAGLCHNIENLTNALVDYTRTMGCCRFQRHRVRCMNETGGEPWRDARLRESLSWRR